MAFPTLNANLLYAGLFNAYKYVYQFGDNLAGLKSNADKYRMEGGNYEDTIVFTDIDVLMTRVFDEFDTNVLQTEMIPDVKQQSVTINKRRQIGLYNQPFLTKQVWGNAAKYDEFAGIVQSQVSKTKKVYDQRLVDCFIGQHTATGSAQNVSITLTTVAGDAEKQNRIQAMEIAQKLADLAVDMRDSSRDFNDNGFLKSIGDVDIYWAKSYYNKQKYCALPTIFNDKDLLKEGTVLPDHYFGHPLTAAEITALSAKANGTTTRAAAEYKIRVDANGEYDAAGTVIKNVFPGDLLPKNTPLVISTTAETTGENTFSINNKNTKVTYFSTVHGYVADEKIICKIVEKGAIKFVSSFDVSSEFFNSKNHSTNYYMLWQYAEPIALNGCAFVTIKSN